VKTGVLLTTLVLLVASAAIGLGAGERWIDPLSPATALDSTILWELRWPRVQTAAAVGALLATAGVCLQVLLGNPLAEPYVLGISGSSTIGALLALFLFPDVGLASAIGAFLGAMVGLSLILPFSVLGPHRLLLAGVVFSALWGAMVSLAMTLLPENELGRAISWMLGNLASETAPPSVLLFGVVVLVAAAWFLAPGMDRLLLGEHHAEMLGVEIPRLRWSLLLVASFATAISVAAAGTIGFVGLVVPHIARQFVGPLHRVLVPVSAAGGATLLLFADAGSRALMSPAELPVGVVTAMIGVPLFLWLLIRRTTWNS